jgi:ubiquinone/menaquinone biosynthesis C-methylase UbiE
MTEWDQILRRKDYSPKNPDEIVVNFVSIIENRKAEKVLDLGCGAGRHVIYLTKRGFETYGTDIAETGLKLTKRRLRKAKLEAAIVKSDMKFLPFICSCFDAAICVQTIYHQRLREIKETVSELHRVLRKKSLLLTNFHSKRSGKQRKGIEVEENTFAGERGPEKGVLHHLVDENEIHELFRDFRLVDLEIREKMTSTSYRRSRYNVVSEKI